MKYFTGLFVALATIATVPVNAQLLLFGPGQSNFKLADRSTAPKILVANNEPVGVARAAQDLAWDFGRVVGVNGTVATSNTVDSTSSPLIIVGTIGKSSLIDNLVSSGKLDVSQTKGKWESYTSQVVQLQGANGSWALVIAGSDRRGAIYGLYDISEQMGVSPWYWWADVPVKTKTSIYVSAAGKIQGPPSVKYRGFFINDESPALSTWIQKKFQNKFGSDFYRLVFELCLRLKGNYMWPAMWGKSFYVDDAKNGQLAHDFGIVMGTSHHEPMARSEKEQQNFVQGGWDWRSNKENIKKFFTDGISRAKNWDTYWTMGMRGSGDAASPTLTASDLEEIIQVQQGLLTNGLNGSSLSNIPQTWVLYKEVSDYYAQGLKVPDTVTLLWTDDNSGNIVRVPTASEANRAAGAGVYYHFDYVGSPRNYKWINSIQLAKTWEQMHLAYTKNARQIWLVNVGDIKPLEVPLTHFMDMAYDFSRHTTPAATNDYIKRWATREFGAQVADATVKILGQYGMLTARRKYELLSEQPFVFSTTNYDEAERNLAAWEALVKLTQSTYDSLDASTQTAFYQLLLHPITAGKTVVDLYTKVAFNKLYADQGRVSANYAAQQAAALFKQDADITTRYHSLNNGKWDGFVNQPHIGYNNWQDPNSNVMPQVTFVSGSQQSERIGVGIQGTSASYPRNRTLSLLALDSNMPSTESRWLEVFALKNGSIPYSISSSASYISFSKANGSLTAPGAQSDQRILITVDWSKVPAGSSSATITVKSGSSSNASLTLPLIKSSVPSTFSGFVESNGVVAIEASHATTRESKNGVSYVEVPDYGRTLSAVKPWPASIASQSPDSAPALKYAFYTTSTSSKARLIVSLGASHNHDPTRPIRFAYSLDGAAAKSVNPVSTTPPYKESADWRKAVVENGWTSTTSLDGTVASGSHSLALWLLEPGVVVQKVVVDMGGLRNSALGPYESRQV